MRIPLVIFKSTLKTYFPSINLLRGIAALLVCLYHFIGYADFRGELIASTSLLSEIGSYGVNGVYIFFVITGFVIPFSLYKDQFKLNHIHRFLARRFFRIEIPYLVSILLVLLVGFLFALKNNSHYQFNIEQFIYHLIYFIPFSNYEWYNVIYWTLAIEFQFYIVIGLLYFFLSSKKESTVIITLVLFGALSFLLPDNRFVFHYSTIFLQGIILFLIKSKHINPTTGFILIGSCIVATAFIHSVEISIFTASTLFVIHTVEINHKSTNRFGDLSYSLYLTHGLIGGNILYLFSRYVDGFSGKVVLIIAAVAASLLFSYLYWSFIENPSRKLSRKITINKGA